MKTSDAARLRNRADRSELRGAIRELRTMTDHEGAAARLKQVSTIIDRAAAKHLIHKKNADRNKSRLALFVNKLK